MTRKTDLVKKEFNGCTFLVNENNPGKLEKDLETVKAIFSKGIDNLTTCDKIRLLQIYKAAYHDSGKIEGVTSLDSTATNCEFCKTMRAANAGNDSCICNICYDMAQEGYRINVMNRHSLNMVIMMTVKFSIDELKYLPLTAIVRVNSSGDTPNYIYACNMINICYAFPHCKIGYWAKNIAPIIKACDDLGKPENLTLIQSSCMIGKPAKKARYFDYVFTVYPDKETTEKAIVAGASECNGKKCRECGYKCYFGSHSSGDNIAELLRGASAEKIKAIKAAL